MYEGGSGYVGGQLQSEKRDNMACTKSINMATCWYQEYQGREGGNMACTKSTKRDLGEQRQREEGDGAKVRAGEQEQNREGERARKRGNERASKNDETVRQERIENERQIQNS
eukprot:1044801-Pleurochrysis_carterae.AAC.1